MASKESIIKACDIQRKYVYANFCQECKEIAKKHGIKSSQFFINEIATALDEARNEALEEAAREARTWRCLPHCKAGECAAAAIRKLKGKV